MGSCVAESYTFAEEREHLVEQVDDALPSICVRVQRRVLVKSAVKHCEAPSNILWDMIAQAVTMVMVSELLSSKHFFKHLRRLLDAPAHLSLASLTSPWRASLVGQEVSLPPVLGSEADQPSLFE